MRPARARDSRRTPLGAGVQLGKCCELTSIELTGLLLVVVIGVATISSGGDGVDAGRAVYLLVTVVASAVVPTVQLAGAEGPLLEVVQTGPLSLPTEVFSAIALFALANGALINMIMA